MKRKKPTKVPEIVPVKDGEGPPKSANVGYLRVGDVWIAATLTAPKTTVVNGQKRTFPSIMEEVARMPFGAVEIGSDIWSAFGKDSKRLFKNWLVFYQYCKETEDDPNIGLEAAEYYFQKAVETGFYLAIMRYADDLKSVPEATAMLEHRRQTAQKNGKARTKKVAPTHKAIQRRFRQLRKESPKKTVRYLRVAEEFEMSDRHVARIVEGID